MKIRILSATVLALTAVTCASCSQTGGVDAAVTSGMKQSATSNAKALPSMVDDAQLSSSTASESPSHQTSSNDGRPAHNDPYLPPQAVIPQVPGAESKPKPSSTLPADGSTGSDTSTNAGAPRPSQPVPVLPTSPDHIVPDTSEEPVPSETKPEWPIITDPKRDPVTTPGGASSPDSSPTSSESWIPQRAPESTAPQSPSTNPSTSTEQSPAAQTEESKPFYCDWKGTFEKIPSFAEKCN